MATATPGLAPLHRPGMLSGREWIMLEAMDALARDLAEAKDFPGARRWESAAAMVRKRLSPTAVDFDITASGSL